MILIFPTRKTCTDINNNTNSYGVARSSPSWQWRLPHSPAGGVPPGTIPPLVMSRPAASAQGHPLTFRVMRLTAATPSRRPTLPFVCSRPEDPPNAMRPDKFLSEVPKFEGEGAPGSVGSVSILPASFGSIYAAETFRSFISTYNYSGATVHSVAVNIEIQTSSQRRISLVTTRTPSNLAVREAVSHVVSSSLPELGVHVLICSAAYVDRTGAARTLRQLFRFNVLPPLEPFVNVIPLHRRRLVAAQDASGSEDAGGHRQPTPQTTMAQFLIDLRIQNTMPVPVFITSATIKAVSAYTAVIPLIRSDDPAAPKAPCRETDSGFSEEAVDALTNLAISSEGKEGACDPLMPTSPADSPKDAISSLPPPRPASVGVGDTRNFMFYVARPLDSTEMPPSTKDLSRDGSRRIASRNSSSSCAAGRPDVSHKTDASHSHPLLDDAGVDSAKSKDLDSSKTAERNSSSSQASASNQVQPSVRREIGYFSLRWHSATGEQGHMTNVIAAFEPAMRSAEIELRIAAIPQDIRVQCPFAARCVARNNRSEAVRLYLQVRRDLVGEIVPLGISGVSLGEVAPGNTKECLLSLIPLSRGQHSISGLRAVDIDTRKSFNAEPTVVSVL